MFDLLISGGTVVTSRSAAELDVAVQGGEIVAIAKRGALGMAAGRVIDARGLYVLPGAIDPHTHIYDEWMGRPVPGIASASVAAAYGGTTTFLDFAHVSKETNIRRAREEHLRRAEGRLAVDYALHCSFQNPSAPLLSEVGSALGLGIPSFKVYMTYTQHTPPAEDGFLLGLMREAAAKSSLVGIHAENPSLIAYSREALLSQGKTGVEFFPQGGPNICEAEAVHRAIFFAEATGAAIYFFHLSTKEALAQVAAARKRGLPVYCETCPHYLAFNDEVYKQEFEKAIQFIRFPPIRSAADQAALWEGVADGSIQSIGTDHVAAYLSVKKELSAGQPFTKMPGGMAQIETRLPLLFSEGVSKGRISVNRLVELLCTNPARIFGLYPKKGIIAPGSDADLVLIDPSLEKRITLSELHMDLDYTIYEGWTFKGYPVITISKGKVIVEGGRYQGSLNDGELLQREIGREILQGGAL